MTLFNDLLNEDVSNNVFDIANRMIDSTDYTISLMARAEVDIAMAEMTGKQLNEWLQENAALAKKEYVLDQGNYSSFDNEPGYVDAMTHEGDVYRYADIREAHILEQEELDRDRPHYMSDWECQEVADWLYDLMNSDRSAGKKAMLLFKCSKRINMRRFEEKSIGHQAWAKLSNIINVFMHQHRVLNKGNYDAELKIYDVPMKTVAYIEE